MIVGLNPKLTGAEPCMLPVCLELKFSLCYRTLASVVQAALSLRINEATADSIAHTKVSSTALKRMSLN